ncbi:diaminopimelate epimerase [Pseudobdellovibrio exovorus]|uniref:Diaminopimelate epimerase n=1 Tax=Pseudobdellovibrio exovorus JSS TaxID=1184267 RepID=M4V518_9BACT|nr:diaminopimelate epimerase [Pseudobdellovibrio exovorus]AGH94278.1 hypothetical protein A11Q_58 [Pseudobdellovibrio exovorus JSS]
MSLLKTHLISGAGNTFHVSFDGHDEFTLWGADKRKEITRRVCAENKADGFIFLQAALEQENHYRWFFYNNDGSDAEMCGNATRCVGYYIKNILKNAATHWSLQTVAGAIRIDFVNTESFKITMTPIQRYDSSLGFFCDTGVPHLVLERQEILQDEVTRQASRKLRFHEEFQPRGTNVTQVVLEDDPKKVKAVSYERGVEDFTDACGTGAMAAAFYNLTKRGESETQVEMPGGTLMMNLFDLDKPTMTGPAILLGSYEYEI